MQLDFLSEAHIIGTIISFIIGVFVVQYVIQFSEKNNLLDKPNERKIHSHPTPRLGGVAIWLSTMLTFAALILLSYYPYGSLLSGILLGGSLMFLLGLVDDIYNLDAKFKLFIQITIVTIVFCLGVRVSSLFVPLVGLFTLPLWLSYIITVLWIVGITNAINFIDGVDGLAGSVITISSITLGLIATCMVPANTVSTLIAFILAGSMLGFLTCNFNPARIFMGDSGALFAGFILSSLSVVFMMKAQNMTMYAPILILSVPILDITFSSVRRIMKGISPFKADAGHIHHKLLNLGLSQNQAVLVLSALALLSGALATYLVSSDLIKYFIYAIGIICVMLVLNTMARNKGEAENGDSRGS